MFNTEDILARLKNGETAQSIAEEMSAALNSANREFESQKEKEALKADAQKKEELQTIIDQLQKWFKTYYKSDNIDELFAEFNATHVLEIFATVEEYFDALVEMKEILKTKPTLNKNIPVGTKILKPSSKLLDADSILTSFFKEMGWF